MTKTNRLERQLITVGALIIGVYNLLLSMFWAPFAGIGQIDDLVPRQALDGSRFALVILGIVLIVTARGLWHGKRSAWAVAIVCTVASVVTHPLKNVDLWGTAGSLVLLGALLGARPQFPARTDPPTALRGLLLAALGFASVFAYSTIGLYFLDKEFRQPLSIWDSLEDGIRLLILLPETAASPITAQGNWFLESVRVSFLVVILFGVFSLLRPVVYRATTNRQDRERVSGLLERFGNSSLAYFALQPDKSYFFSEAGNAVLAFKVLGNTAIVMGDPIGDPAEFPALIEAFQLHCELDGWSYAFHQAQGNWLDLYKQHGLKALKIGEEGYVDVRAFSLSGTPMKHVRATMNRLAREGYRSEVMAAPHSPELIDTLRRISDAWLKQGNRRERSFVVGYFDAAELQKQDVMVARDAGGRIVAFANVVPSFNCRDGNFDLLRFGPEPKGVSDFLYIALIEYFRERGYERMTLGLAPLAGESERTLSPADAAMRLLYRYGSFVFRFKGLREFKEKFASAWEPRYLIYPSDAQLTGIAVAVGRVGEFTPSRHLLRLASGG